jgi:hypothetical protein
LLGGEFQNGDSILVNINSEGEVVLERDSEKEAAPVV